MEKTLKEVIIEKYGSINKFVDEFSDKLQVSRTHFYKLINDSDANPTIATIIKISEATGLSVEDIIHEYCLRHRD